jgi:hypothetical protein
MKIAKIILILVVLLNVFVGNCERVNRYKRERNRRLKHHRVAMKAKNIFETIQSKLSEFAADPWNILYFSLGILSIFDSTIEEIYEDVKTKKGIYENCLETVKKAFPANFNSESDMNDTNIGENQAVQNPQIREFENNFQMMKEQKSDFCNKMQEQLYKNYWEAHRLNTQHDIEIPDWEHTLNGYWRYHTSSWEDICSYKPERATSKFEEIIEKKFRSVDDYKQQCLFFGQMDCSAFDQNVTSTWDFIFKVKKYYDTAMNAKNCVMGVYSTDQNDDNSTGNSSPSVTWEWASSYMTTVLNAYTMGGIKAVYYLAELAYELSTIPDLVEDIPFKIGQIFGKAARIVKTLLGVKRKMRRIK